MSLEMELLAAWPEFRELAGVTLLAGATSINAVAVDDISRETADLFDGGTDTERTSFAILRTDWNDAGLDLGHTVKHISRTWRVNGFRSHPSSPIVIAVFVAEGF